MKSERKKYIRRTDEELHQVALRYNSRSEFEKNEPSCYNIARKRKILDKICSHVKFLYNHKTDEEIHSVALKYYFRSDFEKLDNKIYQMAVKRGLLNKVCSHMGTKWSHKWTTETTPPEALKYTRRSDFKRGSKGAYAAAIKLGILDQVCSHMIMERTYLTDLEIINIASKYESIVDFRNNDIDVYQAAFKHGILEQACAHMKKSKSTSRPEQELFEAIKIYFPTIKKLRIRKKNLILNKPHIQGFDSDIFVPEKNKAIEFDGKYWHSKEGLLRSRNHWPEEDIEVYHQIKDSYFLSQGIELLHIKELDWIKNKESCIKECLDFLGV